MKNKETTENTITKKIPLFIPSRISTVGISPVHSHECEKKLEVGLLGPAIDDSYIQEPDYLVLEQKIYQNQVI